MADAAVVYTPGTITAGSTRIEAGATTDFVVPPTMVNINASSQWNQLIAIANRRASQIFITPPSTVPYVAPDVRPTASQINAFRTQVNILRRGVGRAAFAFGAAKAVGDKILRQDLIDLRLALDFSGQFVIVADVANAFISTRTDNPYGSLVTQGSGGVLNGLSYGKATEAGTQIRRTRFGISFRIFAGIGDGPATVTLHIVLGNQANGWTNTLETFTPAFYSSNSDDHLGALGWQNHADNFIASGTYGLTTDQLISVPISRVAARAGSYMSFVIGEDHELTGSGSGGPGLALFKIQSPGIQFIELALDYGWGASALQGPNQPLRSPVGQPLIAVQAA